MVYRMRVSHFKECRGPSTGVGAIAPWLGGDGHQDRARDHGGEFRLIGPPILVGRRLRHPGGSGQGGDAADTCSNLLTHQFLGLALIGASPSRGCVGTCQATISAALASAELLPAPRTDAGVAPRGIRGAATCDTTEAVRLGIRKADPRSIGFLAMGAGALLPCGLGRAACHADPGHGLGVNAPGTVLFRVAPYGTALKATHGGTLVFGLPPNLPACEGAADIGRLLDAGGCHLHWLATGSARTFDGRLGSRRPRAQLIGARLAVLLVRIGQRAIPNLLAAVLAVEHATLARAGVVRRACAPERRSAFRMALALPRGCSALLADEVLGMRTDAQLCRSAFHQDPTLRTALGCQSIKVGMGGRVRILAGPRTVDTLLRRARLKALATLLADTLRCCCPARRAIPPMRRRDGEQRVAPGARLLCGHCSHAPFSPSSPPTLTAQSEFFA
jgi:hypothetical protein